MVYCLVIDVFCAVLSGPTTLTIKVAGEQVSKIISTPGPPLERTVSNDSETSLR